MIISKYNFLIRYIKLKYKRVYMNDRFNLQNQIEHLH